MMFDALPKPCDAEPARHERHCHAARSAWGATLLLLGLAGWGAVVPVAADDAHPTLTIRGGTEEQQNNVRAQMNLDRRSCELPDFREAALVRDVTERAARALRALGFYNPELDVAIERDDDCYRVVLEIEPGPQTTIVEVMIDYRAEVPEGFTAERSDEAAGFVRDPGTTIPALAAFLAAPGVAVGDPLRHDTYDATRARMQRVAQEQGFLTGRWIERRLLVDPERNEARVELVYDVGPRYRFGEVSIPQTFLRESFVERLVPFEPGDIYAARSLLRLQRNIDASGYFASARVRPNLDDADDEFRVPIDVEVVPRNRWVYEAGLGFSTDVGARLRLGVENRYVNRRGHRAQADLELSQRRSGVSARYQIPLANPLTERLEFTASLRREDTDTQKSDRAQLGVSRVRTRPSGWTVTEGVRYERERFTVADETRTTNFVIPSYQLTRTHANDDLFPTRGYRVSLLAQGASESLGSSATFVQGVARGKFIHPLGPGRLITRGDAAVTATSNVRDLPSSLRFFAGGDTSIRGFGFERLGPTDDQGRVIGGRHLLVGSAEYEHPVGERFGAAAFVDVGNAFDEFDDIDPKIGIGAGVRWRSPVGPIRVDVAHGIDARDAFRIHFTMGPDL